MTTLAVGDTVQWRGSFGKSDPAAATILRMEVTDEPRSKYGDPVAAVPVSLVRENRVVFDLSNGHWCYSEQIVLPAEDADA